MENIVKKLEEQCKNTLVERLGMEFTGYGEGWMTMKMPVDHRTCVRTVHCTAVPIWHWPKR